MNVAKGIYRIVILTIIIYFSTLNTNVFGQKMTPQQYIDTYKNEAIKNMKDTGIPASITLAQGMLESGNGNSELARKGKNHFGIKCHSDWKGKSMKMDDDKKNECFRKYNSVLESYADHANFLTSKQRYAFLFDLKITNYKGWARGLKKAGYATSPTYAPQLISIIERYGLFKYDQDKGGGSNKNNNYTGTVSLLRLNDIKYTNRLKSIIINPNESVAALAIELGIKEKRIRKYNELGLGDEIAEGDLIYLETKRNRALKAYKFHTVEVNETIYSISQKYGIKVKWLLKRNNMWFASKLNVGEQLYLRKYKPLNGKKPILRLF